MAMMATDLNNILERFAAELQNWLASPSETSGKIAAMKKQIEALKGEVAAEPLNAAIKALEESDKQVRRQRQKQAADAIAAAMKPLGVMLVAKAPPKKQRGKSSTAGTSSFTSTTHSESTSTSTTVGDSTVQSSGKSQPDDAE